MQAKPLATQNKRTSEIAEAVQAGKADILSLWAAVERFAWQQTLRWVRAMEGRAGVEESDLLQVAFISLMDTLPTWDVSKGEFLTLYGIKLKAELTEACGQRTQRTRCDPINTVCRSVDEPIGEEDSGLTLGDAIADEAAEEAFEDIEQRDFQQAVQAALAQLTDAQREAIIGEFWFGRKPDPKLRREALRALRHPRIRNPLVEFYR